MKYTVHVFTTFRLAVKVDADSHMKACHTAADVAAVELLQLPTVTTRAGELSYSDEITGFLVDEAGDDDHTRSRDYLSDGLTLRFPKRQIE